MSQRWRLRVLMLLVAGWLQLHTGGGLELPLLSDNLIDDDDESATVSQTTVEPSTTSLSAAIVENLRLINATESSISVAWNVADAVEHVFLLQLFRDEQLLQNHSSQQTDFTFGNLGACCPYKVVVQLLLLLPDAASSPAAHILVETAFLAPGQVSGLNFSMGIARLQVSWSAPEAWARCVREYRLSIDSESGPSDTGRTNGTQFAFERLHACTSYRVSVTPVDSRGQDGRALSGQSPPTLKEVPGPPRFLAEEEEEEATAAEQRSANSTSLVWRLEDRRNNCSLLALASECRYEGTLGWGYELCNGSALLQLGPDWGGGPAEPARNLTARVEQLSPFTRYLCRARLLNEQGAGPWSPEVSVRTAEDRPSAPQRFQSQGRSSADNRLGFSWLAPRYNPGKLAGYRLNFTWQPSYPWPKSRECLGLERSYVVRGIAPDLARLSLDREEACAHYRASISANTGAGHSPEVSIEFDSMSGGRPGRVTNLRCEWRRRAEDPSSLETVLQWALPCASRGLLYQFEVSVLGTRPQHENQSFSGVVEVADDYTDDTGFDINFGELRPLYRYDIQVVATIRGGPAEPGEAAECAIEYPAGIPPQPAAEYVASIRLDPQKARRSTSSAAILLPLFPEDNGQIRYYAVMVSGLAFANASGRFELSDEPWRNVSSWEEAWERDFGIAYQATEPKWQPFPSHVVDYGHMKAVKFVIGEDATCPEVSSNTKTRAYCNGPLKPDTWYEVRMRAFTDHGYADSVAFRIKTNAELNVALVLGVVFGVLLLGILATLMLLLKRCSFRLLLQRIARSNIPESPVPNPLTRAKFLKHCQQLLDNPAKLSGEFQLLQTLSVELQMPSNAACLQANRKKNRYSDILPYDFSRVKLEIIDNDPNTDYINASFIRGYSSNEEYIACQGPKDETSHDFWRMVEQYDVKMIVMLTQLVERGREKCHQYFPAIGETLEYEQLSIKCTSELDYHTYTHRTLLLQKEDKRRTIMHLHFKDWPDHDVPDDFDAMIQFCQMFRKQMSGLKGLSVIHCSAGIGRTGTLIAIDILLQCIRDNRKLDVFGSVYRLRRHRLNMVQRESQYAYIYNCIRQVLKNPYFLKSYKPPPIEPVYCTKAKKKKDAKFGDSSPDIVDSLDTLRKASLSASMDSLQPLCQSSPQATPRIPMNSLRYCKSTSAIDTRSQSKRIGRYNSEGYAICGSGVDSMTSSGDEIIELSESSKSDSMYENVEPLLIRPSSSQTTAACDYYLTNAESETEKDTSL